MLTTILCGLAGVLAGLSLALAGASNAGWSVVWGTLVFAACHVAAGLWMRRRVQALMAAIQATLTTGQKRLQQKINQWQVRPPGSLRQAQIEVERDQRAFVQQALEQAAGLKRYFLWSPLLRRQSATLRMQLHYQLHEFDAVDRLLPHCLILDPLTASMKLARLHQRGEKDLERFYRKQTRRLRYGQGAVLHALYAWILVQRGDPAGAHKVLVRACDRIENETLARNRDHLANNRVSQFSNAGLGDEWYALGLEQPRIKTQRQRMPGGRPF